MCGRTACTLDPHEIQRACAYKQGGQWKVPEWRENTSGKEYKPIYNISPTCHTPVLTSRRHFSSENLVNERVIQQMHWGVCTAWNINGSNAHNARSETIVQKPTFSKPLKEGRRCVVIADGYFEWKTTGKKKQPYFIYFPQEPGISIENHEWRCHDVWSDNEGWKGPRLLTMAGIFDVYQSKNGNTVYSYAVITTSSAGNVSFIHDRMPVILDGNADIDTWLDSSNVNVSQALELVNKVPELQYHVVSDKVNNSRYQMPSCILVAEMKSTMSGLDKWLKASSKDESKPTTSQQSSPLKPRTLLQHQKDEDVQSLKKRGNSSSPPLKRSCRAGSEPPTHYS